jgi:hypothetical protein
LVRRKFPVRIQSRHENVELGKADYGADGNITAVRMLYQFAEQRMTSDRKRVLPQLNSIRIDG